MCICEKCIHCEVCDEWSKEFLHRTPLYPVENENDCDHYKSKKEYNIEIVEEFADRLINKADLIKINDFDSKWAISEQDIDEMKQF